MTYLINSARFAVIGGSGGGGSTWNPSDKGSDITLSGSNLIATGGNTGVTSALVRSTTSHSTGKFYAEIVLTTLSASNYPNIGIAESALLFTNAMAYASAGNYASIQPTPGFIYRNGAYATSGITLTSGDVVNLAPDLTANKIWIGKNGTYINSGNPSAGTNPSWTGLTAVAYFLAAYCFSAAGAVAVATLRTTSAQFGYTMPTGWSEWG